ncbi:hypothetical protein DET47_102318 [Shewanella putrefaciens]|nr:hypothetical protein DET47_102318 [Shewanella putrefaciens]
MWKPIIKSSFKFLPSYRLIKLYRQQKVLIYIGFAGYSIVSGDFIS